MQPIRIPRNLGLLCVIFGLLGCSLANRHGHNGAEFRILVRVVDGDTLAMDNGERVRLIGVDTPETKDPRKPVEYFGNEAAVFTKRVTEGKRVRLEYDQANAARDHKDNTPQRRTLAYVYLEDGTLLNAEIIRQGYGYALTRYPFSRVEDFRRLEREARDRRRGLWADNP